MHTPLFYTYVGTHGNQIIHKYVDVNGVSHISVEAPTFELFIPNPTGEYVGLYENPLSRREFESPKDMTDFVRQYQDVMKIHGMTKAEYQFIANTYPDRPVSFDFSKIKIVNVDIETEIGNGFPDPEVAEQPINAITVSLIGSQKSTTWTTCDYHPHLDEDAHPDNTVLLCEDEEMLTAQFLVWWNDIRPDAITGWNIEGFDIPYMVNRFSKVVGASVKMLSPIHDLVYRPIRSSVNGVTEKTEFKIAGLAVLDYLAVFKKFNFASPPDFKLETIAQMIIGEGKVDYGEYDTLKEFYLGNPTKFVRYNIKDVRLINKMDEKLNYLLLAYTLTYAAKCNPQDIFGQVKFWDVYIYNFLKNMGIQIPPSKNIPSAEVEGAYVADPKLGKTEWVVTVDLTSLN